MSTEFASQSPGVHLDFCDGGAKNMKSLYLQHGAFCSGSETLSLPDTDKALTDPGRYGKEDKDMHVVFAKDDEEFLNDVEFIDEAYFLLNDHINSKNHVLGRRETSLSCSTPSALRKAKPHWFIFL